VTTPRWTKKLLYLFCKNNAFPCLDGDKPEVGLIADGAGNLFGASCDGGGPGWGLVFESKAHATKPDNLHVFCKQAGCSDGAEPVGALILDKTGTL
jgi:hypothetical protein